VIDRVLEMSPNVADVGSYLPEGMNIILPVKRSTPAPTYPLAQLWEEKMLWKTVRETGDNLYQVNIITKKRRVKSRFGLEPVDKNWLKTGMWSPAPAIGNSGTPPR